MRNLHAQRAYAALAVLSLSMAAIGCRSAARPEETVSVKPAGGLAPKPVSPGPEDGRSIETMFAGRFPGVTVVPTDNGGLQIRIRGGSNSFYGSDEPLYVIDDIPQPPNNRGIVFINPHDIERIEVLKNPSDIGIYGVRGGNGVVKITTKKPKG